ncbi:MAG: hypothetical protein GY777_25575 [Candidatus Brocadiaceae bacterium]|nr:hypothetical protein [Candidatus Brocadiaceae bacterium]
MKYNEELLRFLLMFQYGADDIFFHSYKDDALLSVINYVTFQVGDVVKHLTIIDRDEPLTDTFDIQGSQLRGRDSAVVWTPEAIIIFNVKRIAEEIHAYRNNNGAEASIPVSAVEHLFTKIEFNKYEDE